MTRIFSRPEIGFPQLCAIARCVLVGNLGMDDAEWKGEVLAQVARLEFAEPNPRLLTQALSAVERAVAQTVGPRVMTSPAKRATPPVDTRPLTPKEWALLRTTLRRVIERTAAVGQARVAPPPRETLVLSEVAALDQFYAEASADRLGALKRFAELAIVRGPEWDPAAIRAAATAPLLRALECFACRTQEHALNWHHVIQIQHGGSNYARNRVALCDGCHAEVHPWLPQAAPRPRGWFGLGDMARPMTLAVDAKRARRAS